MNLAAADRSFTAVDAVRPGICVQRRFARLSNGLIRLDQDTRSACAGTGLDVTGPYWIFAIVSPRLGRVSYFHGRELVHPPGTPYGVFFPPYSVVQCRLDQVQSQSRAVAGRAVLPPDHPRQPVAFEVAGSCLPGSVEGILGILRTRRVLVAIGRERNPSPLSHRVKALIDEGFRDLPPLSVLAAKLHTSPAVMSRYFTRDYGMPPVRYRHAIRVMDALMRLIAGEPVAQVAGQAGFDDLGQFYRQFGRLALAPPGRYRLPSGDRADAQRWPISSDNVIR
jgi:AraC-like DNA-binding protein